MPITRNYTLCIITMLIAMRLIGVIVRVSTLEMGFGSEDQIRPPRSLAIRLVSLTSPDPDPRHPVDWLHIWATSLDQRLSDYVLSAND